MSRASPGHSAGCAPRDQRRQTAHHSHVVDRQPGQLHAVGRLPGLPSQTPLSVFISITSVPQRWGPAPTTPGGMRPDSVVDKGCANGACGSKWARESHAQMTKGPPLLVALSEKVVRRRPTLPPPLGGSTIGAGRLNFRVRDGSGCFPVAMAAVTLVTHVCLG